jgi:membrane protein DedA with SNARE-associated domain
VVPPFAGIANLRTVPALVPMALASGIWYGALTLVAATLVKNLDQIARFVVGLNQAGLGLAAVLGVVALVLLVRRRRRAMEK